MFNLKFSIFIIASLFLGCSSKFENSRDVTLTLQKYLLLNKTNSILFTAPYACKWILKKEKNGYYLYVEDSQENWSYFTNSFWKLYGAPRVHLDQGKPTESIFFGNGNMPTTAGLDRACSEHEDVEPNTFGVIIDRPELIKNLK